MGCVGGVRAPMRRWRGRTLIRSFVVLALRRPRPCGVGGETSCNYLQTRSTVLAHKPRRLFLLITHPVRPEHLSVRPQVLISVHPVQRSRWLLLEDGEDRAG